MLRLATFAALAASACVADVALAQERGSGTAEVSAFESICLQAAPDYQAIVAKIDADSNWSKSEFPQDYQLDKASFTKAWSGKIGAKSFQILVAKASYATVCMLRTVDKEPGIYPYFDPLRVALKQYNIKGKSVDLPHQFIAAGKTSNGRIEVKLTTRMSGIGQNYTAFIATF